MGTFSIWHWLILLLLAANIAMVVQIAVSNRTRGFKKGMFVALMLIIPYLPYFVWLVMRDSNDAMQIKDAQVRAQLAEAAAREAEAQARVARATPLELSATRQS